MKKTATRDGVTASLSIGDLAEATGVAPDTIRAWERRYGRPEPVRLPSGHRRYTDDHVNWLRRVGEAMALGHRTGKVVRADEEALEQMLQMPLPDDADPKRIVQLMKLVYAYRREELVEELQPNGPNGSSAEHLEREVAPLLIAVGRAWSEGKLQVRHEHFLSEVIEDLIRQMRLEVRTPAIRGTILLATLQGEAHGIGVQMTSLLVAEAGFTPRILGTETPLLEIARAAEETRALAVAISVSLASGGVETDRRLSELRGLIPHSTSLVIGGRGARGIRRGPRGIDYVSSLPDFSAWVADLGQPDRMRA